MTLTYDLQEHRTDMLMNRLMELAELMNMKKNSIVLIVISMALLICSCGSNGRNSESRQARLDGRVVTDLGKAKNPMRKS